MNLHREGTVWQRMNAKHELFFIPLGIILIGIAVDMGPESEATFVEKMSAPVKGPRLDFCVQPPLAQKPFVPQEKSTVRSSDSARLVSLTRPPVQAKTNWFRKSTDVVKDIVGEFHLSLHGLFVSTGL